MTKTSTNIGTEHIIDQAGRIDDLFSPEELVNVTKYLSRFPKDYEHGGNSFAGIGNTHPFYQWLDKGVFDRIKKLFPVDIKLLFGSYLDESNPWEVHSDYYHAKFGTPYMAYLIPISVNYDMRLVNKTNTVIFDQEDRYVDTSDCDKTWSSDIWKQNRIKQSDNATNLAETLLSHIPTADLECLTTKYVANWKLGSVIYWDEKLLHTSDNFIQNGIRSKQALVLHTYVV